MPTRSRRATAHPDDAQREQPAEILRPQRVAARQDRIADPHVLAHLDDVFAGRDRPQRFDGRRADLLGLLDHHHRVGAVGQHAAGGDAGALARPDRRRRRAAHEHFVDQLEVGRQTFGGAERVGGAHREAVHRRSAERRQVARRADVFGQHAIECVARRDVLDRDSRPAGARAGG